MLENGFAADVQGLQAHQERLRQEQQLARRLLECLEEARRLALPEEAWRYDDPLRGATRLVRYFSAMGDQMDIAVEELTRLSLDIRLLLLDTSSDIQRETGIFFPDGWG